MPTLSLSTAAPSPVPFPVSASPIAVAPGVEGAGDAFAAMLAGLTALPAADSAPPAAAQATAGAPLPQVRQDPAAWLPDESPDLPVEITSVDPVIMGGGGESPKLKPLNMNVPDCEMPAELEGAPIPLPVRASLPAVANPQLPVSKGWTLRLSSALTPARAAAHLPSEIEPTVEAPQTAEKPKLVMPLAAPNTVIELPAQAIALPTQPPSAVEAEVPVPATAPLPAAKMDAATTSPERLPADAKPSVPITAPQSGPAQDRATAPQLPAAESHEAKPNFAPELVKQIEQAIASRSAPAEPELREAVPAPIQVAAPVPTPALVQAPSAPSATPVPAQPAPVDVGRAEWVQAMVDRIAELPQAEGRREAQITLIPAALGKVEVNIVHRDEQVQVTLNAETVQARQLLAEAAPRLQEMAEARGLRLAEPQVGGGPSQDRRSAPDQQPQTPQRPRSASAAADDDPQPQRDLVA